MKKTLLSITCVFIFNLLTIPFGRAQSIGNYAGLPNGTFTAVSGTFTSISGTGNMITFTSPDDGTSNSLPLGFTFVYMGVPYTSCFGNTNGYISFSPIAPAGAATYGPLNNVGLNFHPAVCAYLLDLILPTPTGYYQTTGSVGSRVFTFELPNCQVWFSGIPPSFPPSFSIQIKLYESSGKIELVYDRLSGTQSALAAIGLTASSTKYLGLSDTSSAPTPDTLTSAISLPGRPVKGQIYRFEPSTSVGSGLSFGSFNSVKTTSMSFDWTHTTPGNTIGYLIERSTNGGTTYTTMGSVFTTTYNATGLTPATTYMWRITPLTEGYPGTASAITASQSTTSCSQFSGTVEIGASGSFATIKGALDSFNNVGISGNTVLELQSSYTSAGEPFPLTISDMRTHPCNVSNPRLTVRPAVGASNLEFSGNAAALFILDGAYNFTMDGRPGGTGTAMELHLKNISTTGTIFTLQNDAIGNTIKYCNIRAANSNTASGAIFIGGSTKLYGNDSNVFSNNLITKAPGYTLGSGLSATGTSLLIQNENNSILNNEFQGWSTFGVNIAASAGNGANWNISGNSFYDSATSTSTAMTAINFIPGTASNSVNNIISGNYIGGNKAFAGGSPWTSSATSGTFRGIAITCNPGTPTLVQSNVIQNISFTSTTTAPAFTGINPLGGSLIIGGSSVTGNTIGHESTASSIATTGNHVLLGISSSTGNDIVISHNMIANITQSNTGTSGAIRGIINTSGVSVYINNNTVKSLTTNSGLTGVNTAASVVGIFMQSGASNQYILDNIIGNGTSEPLRNSSTTASVCVVGIGNTSGITLIKGNKINGLINNGLSTGTTSSASITGIFHQGTAGCVVSNNEIRNATSTGASSNQIQGIYINTSSPTDILDNLISGFTSASTSVNTGQTASMIGISYSATNPANIKNNTIENFLATANASNQIVGINSIGTLTNIEKNMIRNLASNSSSTNTTLASITGIAITSASVNKTIKGNSMYNFHNYHTTAASAITGIYFTNGSGFGNNSNVNNNLIHSFSLATSGIGVITGIYNGSGNANFYNNMIRLGRDSSGNLISGPYTLKGIVQASVSSNNYYYNSIYLAGSSAGTSNTACMEFSTTITSPTETVNVKNNIFYNNIANSSTGRNACIRMSVSNGRIFSNYNILYAPNTGGATGIIGTTAYTSLTGSGGWNETSLVDGQSGAVDPSFVNQDGGSNDVDLHLNGSNPAEGAGDPGATANLIAFLNTIDYDYDGQIRSASSPTDIGADAGNFTTSSDNFPPTISFIPLTNTGSTGNRTFSASIMDHVGLPLASSSNAPRVYFRKSTGTYFSTQGTLASGDRMNGTWNFTIDATLMSGLVTGDTVSYYVLAQDSAGNIVSSAMYAVASNVNSVATDVVLPNTYFILSPLPTTISVGTGQTYTTLTDDNATGLFKAINAGGLQGNTVVEITSDLTETGTIALNQWIETGGSNFTLTIRPDGSTKRVISGSTSPTNGLIRLNGADRVTFTGIPSSGASTDTFLVIRGTSTSQSVLTLMSDATFNTFQNCIIEGASTSTIQGAIFISSTSNLTTGNDNNSFIGCHIRGIGTTLAVGIYSVGSAPTVFVPMILQENITISGCHIYNWTSNGISVSGTGNGNGWKILNNHFYWTGATAATAAQTSINFIPGLTSNGDTIEGNYIGGMGPFAGGSAWTNSGAVSNMGISVSSGTQGGTVVRNNIIRNILLSGVSTTNYTGINISGGEASVTSNTIGDLTTANSMKVNGTGALIGINSTTAFTLTIGNNTVGNLTALGALTGTAVRGITVTSGTYPLNVNNNTITTLMANSTNTGSSTGASVVGIGVGSSGNVQNIMNNSVKNLSNVNTTAGHCVVGIYTVNGLNKVTGNTVSGLFSSSTGTSANSAATPLLGMLMQSNLGLSEYADNSISDLRYENPTPGSVQMIGLLVNTGGGFTIKNNTIFSLNSMSVSTGTTTSSAIIGLSYSGSSTHMNISQNTIHSLNHNNSSTAALVNVIGLYTSGATFATGTSARCLFSGNKIHSLKLSTTGAGTLYGIYNATGFSLFENNMIRVGIDSSGNGFTGPYNVYGIFQAFSNNNCLYYHNSVYLGGTPASGTSVTSALRFNALYTTASTRAIVANNILHNAASNSGTATGKNFALRMGDSSLIFSNYNILYANGTGGITVGTNTADYTNLSGANSWQMLSGQDLNSGSGNPMFINTTGGAGSVNLHLSSSNPAEGNGDPLNTSLVDFDGNTRSARTPVDIGAHSDNFTETPDIFPPTINFNPLNNTSISTGSRTLANVSVTDNLGIPMTGTSQPRIYFSKDGNTWYSDVATAWTGTSTNAIGTFAITYATMGGVATGDTIRYFVIAQDNAGNVMSNAYAGATDVNTITQNPPQPLTFKINTLIPAGTKLKVGNGQPFTTLTGSGGLFEYLNGASLGGDVLAVITSNTTEPGAFGLKQFGDNGSGNFTLTIAPDSLTTSERLLSGDLADGLIRLDGADRVKISGVPDFNGSSTDKKLRFRNSNIAGRVFSLINEATDNRLHNLNIEGANTSVTIGAAGIVFIGTSNRANGNSRDTISGCVLGHDQTGILPLGVPAVDIHNFGSPGRYNTANVIMDNELTNFTQHGVMVSNVGTGDDWIITDNSFYRSLPFAAFAAQQSIAFDPSIFSGGHTISNNFIGGSSKNCGGSPWVNSANVGWRAISCTFASVDNPTTIANNVIQNISMTNMGTASQFIGIAIISTGNFNITNNLLGHPTNINSINIGGAAGHIGILTQSNGIVNMRGNALQGINISTPAVNSTFLGLSLFYGFATAVDNTIGSATVANSIRYAGASTFSAIQSIIAATTSPTVLIDSNTVANITATGKETNIQVRGIFHSGAAVASITSNKVFNLSVNSSNTTIGALSAVNGVAYTGSSLGGTVANNTVYNITAANTGAVLTNPSGISMTTANNLTISNNRIYDIINLSTNTFVSPPPTASGIHIQAPQGLVNVQNNQISLGTGQSSNTQFIGIWQSTSGNFTVNTLFNSVYIGGATTSGSLPSFGFLRGNNFVSSGYTSVVNAKNNILMNNRKGGTAKQYAIGNQNIITTFQSGWLANASDYNLLSSSSATPIGLWNVSDYGFSDWKSNSASDGNSLNVTAGTGSGQLDPDMLFQNTSLGNLTLINTNPEKLLIQGKATPISGITTDFNNISRNSSAPTIGSSEALPNDVGVTAILTPANDDCENSVTKIKVTVTNFGGEGRFEVPVGLEISGDATLTAHELVPGTIPPYSSVDYTFTATFSSSLGGNYDITAYTELSYDELISNDTSTINVTIQPNPIPSYTYSDTCAGSTVMFTSTSTVSGSTITNDEWLFGDGGSASGSTASRMYATPGTTYNVQLKSTSGYGCADSVDANIFILTPLNPGTIASDQTICYNTTPAMLTSASAASGSAGTYEYQWQSSTDGSSFTDIGGATTATYSPGSLTADKWYRRSVTTTEGCGPEYTASVKISVYADLTSGSIGTDQTICYNTTPAGITQTGAATGGDGTYTYTWEMSTDGTNFSPVSGATSSTYSPGALTVSTWYRRITTSGSGCGSRTSSPVKITVYPDLTSGSIGTDQTICYNTTPAGLTQTGAATGGDGTYTYSWEMSTNGTTFSPVSGATSSTYSPGALTVTTWYQRITTSGSGCGSRTSSPVKITVYPDLTSGSIGTDQTICYNTTPAGLTQLTASTGGDGTYTYSWEMSTDGTSFSPVSGATSSTYSPGALTASTWYRRITTSGSGCGSRTTSSVKITVYPDLTSGSIGTDQTICYNTTPAGLTQTGAATGGDGTYTYSWEMSTNGTTFSPVSGATSSTYSPGALTVTTWYQRITTSGSGCGSRTSSPVKITVYPDLTSGSIGTDQTICYNTTPAGLTQTGAATGGDGTYTYSWEMSTDGTNFSPVSGASSSTYSPGALTVTTWYRRIVRSYTCDPKTSAAVKITVYNDLTAGTIGSNQTICKNTAAASIGQVTAPTGGNLSYTYNWQSSNNNSNWTDISGAAATTYNPGVLTDTTNYRLKVTSGAGCGTLFTSSVRIATVPYPVTAFDMSAHCFSDTVPIVQNSSIAVGSIAGYMWDFGGGITSTLPVPRVVYATSGIKTVKLVTTSNFGCKDSLTKTVNVANQPVPDFTWVSNCQTLNFINKTSVSCGVVTDYLWKFHDGQTSNLKDPSHFYASTGTFDVKLVITLTGGFKDSVTFQVTLHGKSVAGFSVDDKCQGATQEFTNTSTNFATSNWTFGDGTTSTNASPSKVYASSGTYSVRLITNSASNCRDTSSKVVTVFPNPVAGYNFSNNCVGLNLTFTNTSTGAVSYVWDFADASGSTATSTTHAYATAGNYGVKLVATTNKGCRDSVTKTVTAFSVPVADFSVPNNCLNDVTTFTNNTTGATRYDWDFGDGQIGSAASPTHSYASPGTYTVTLTASTPNNCVDLKTRTITIYPRANVSFTQSNVCIGTSMSFVNGSSVSSGTLTHLWNFGDGTTSNIASPGRIYAGPGLYNVKLVITTNNGCKDSLSKDVRVYANPVAAFSASNVCHNDTSKFTSQSTNAAIYQWSFGDNTVSSVSDPSHVYASVGSYVVKLVVTSANGCKDSISKTVNVYVNPVVAFDVADVCYNDSSVFKNNSSNAGSFVWDFGDNNTSTLSNPSHLYYTSGSYQVKLKATSPNGCVTSGTKTHIVKVRPDADIVTDDRCFGDSTPFLNGSLYAHTFNWDFGDGTGSTIKAPMHLYGSTGTFNVKLVAYNNNGCVDSTYSTATIRTLPVASFAASNVCDGNSVTFNNTSTNANTFVWNFGDGSGSTSTSPTYSYGNPGTYTVSLQAITVYGCKNSTTGSVTVHHTPVANFSTANVCNGKPVSFTNTSSIGSGTISYVWDFGDATTSTATSPTHTYTAAGVYSVTLTVTSNNSCSDKMTRQVTVLTAPTASYTVSNACLGTATSFTNTSINANTYSWTFGDGGTSTATHPNHTYNTTGTYTVTLTARNTSGCEHVYSTSVTIYASPSVSFTANTVCEGTATTFTNNSSVSTGTMTYLWSFGNGNTSTTSSPTHMYGGPGTFGVTLVGTTNNGCGKSYSAQVTVNAMPKSDFSMSDACINTAVAFSNKSTGGNTYNWNFGNGSSSTAANPTFTYITSGTFTVTLTVTSVNNCVAVSSRSITIHPNPVANFTATNVCHGQAMTFTNTSTGTASSRWEFGNGFVSGVASPSYTYPAAGTYNVLLTATSANGCKNDITKSVTVYSQPIADFTVANVCLGTSASFNNLTNGTNSYTWNFGDATNSNATNPTKSYASAGTYNVQLTAVNTNGCNSNVTKPIIVFAAPVASFTTTDKCLGEAIVMNNSSTGAVVYNWNFGDNSTSSLFAPVKFYSTAGTYTVTLTAWSSNNCSNITTRNVTVNPNPVAAFTAAPTCTDATAAFTNNSTISSGTISSSWLFGDGASSNLSSPSHTYPSSGTYLAILNVQSAFGCKASTSSVVSVFDAPVADFNADAVCLGENTLFANTSTNANSSSWTFGDGGTSALMFPSHKYATSGTFNVNLTVLGDRGCTSVKSKTVTVNANPTAAFTAANGCQGTAINFNNSSTGANSYQWQFGSEGTDVNMNPAFTFNNPGTVSVKLTAISSQGCRHEVSRNLEVYSSPRASFGVLNNCAGDQTRFVNFSQNGNSNNWNFGDGGSSANSNPSHQYAGAGTYTVTLTVNNANCMNIATQNITINALPSSNFNFTQSGRDVNFAAVNASAKTYNWNFGDGSQGSAKDENHVYATAIVQKFNVCLNVTDNNGCGSETCKEVSINLLGVDDLQSSDISIVVYPNPNKGNFSVALPSGIGNARVVLESLLGVQVAETSGYDGQIYPFKTENLASGVYMVKVTLDGKTTVQRVVIGK